MDRFRDIDYVVQRASLMALFERFRPILIIPERHSMGEPVVEQWQRDKLPVQPFYTTNETKRIAIEALANAFERADIQILNDETLIAELQAYQAERLPSGMFRYAAPEGMHDDTVMALAMASSGTTPVSYKAEAAIGLPCVYLPLLFRLWSRRPWLRLARTWSSNRAASCSSQIGC